MTTINLVPGDPNIKIGSIVNLKSGSPDLTVISIGWLEPSDLSKPQVPKYLRCMWFDQDNNKQQLESPIECFYLAEK